MSRTIVVGDVHGCAEELAALLTRVDLGADDDLVMVGDLVVRGPDPSGVIALVREHGGRSVRGNHEHRLLTWRALHQGETHGAELSPQDLKVMKSKGLKRTARLLSDEDWAYLEALPLTLPLPCHEAAVVHAGVLPGLPLEAQTARTLLYLRALDEAGRPIEERDCGTPWGARYTGPPHIVFGHYAQSQPQLHPWATGIDTGCVYGGRLTALVLEPGPVPPVAERAIHLSSVPARMAYYPITPS